MRFFVLTFVISIPFWLLGATTSVQLLPGIPVSAFAFVCPGLAAMICTYGESKSAGVRELLKRTLDYSRTRAKVWYVPVALLMPAISILTYGMMRLTGMPLPGPQFSPPAALAMFLAFCLDGAGRRVGLVRVRHRPAPGALGGAESQRSGGGRLGRLALRAVDPGSPIDDMDCLVVTLHHGATGSDRVAV